MRIEKKLIKKIMQKVFYLSLEEQSEIQCLIDLELKHPKLITKNIITSVTLDKILNYERKREQNGN